MNCQDVQKQLSAPSPGGTTLTERALVHAHLAQCADCQAQRAALQAGVGSPPGVEPATARLITRVAPSLLWLRATLLSAWQEAERGVAPLRALVSSSLTVSRRGPVRAIDAARATLTRVTQRLPLLAVPRARAVAGLVGARVPRLLNRLGSAMTIACRGAARAAGEAAAAVSRSFAKTTGAASTGIGAGRGEAMRTRDALFRVGGRLAALLAPSARAVGHVVGAIPGRVRAHPGVCAGIVSGVVLVASILFLGPRQWPDTLVPRLSPGERLSRDVRLPVDRKPAEPVAATPVVIQVAPPRPASGPGPGPTPRVASPETHAAIPAPVRRATAPAPLPSTEATPDPELSDPAAAIDWLVKGTGRRHAERP